MQKFMASAVVLVAVLGASGCEKKDAAGSATPQLGAVAIIDLDVIAARLGSDKQIVDAIARRQTALSQKVAELARAYSQQITEKKQSLSAQTPPTDGVTLAAFEQAATANLEKVKLQAAQDLSSHKTQLVRQFREQIRPVARQVARQRGLSVIVTKNDSVVFDFAGGVDITDSVVNAMLATATTDNQQTPQPASR